MTDQPRSDIAERDPKCFDCASIANVPDALVAEATGRLIEDWDDLVASAREIIARVLAPEDHDSYREGYEPQGHLNLFTNTTSALSRVLSRIDHEYQGSSPTLLTTDLEFAGCIAAIDDLWSGPVAIAQVASAVVSDREGGDSQLHLGLVRAFNFIKPSVVFVSHVVRTTGQVLASETVRYFREANPRVIIVLDGSQAVGNIAVEHDLLQYVDFYIGSGHKWLGGMPSTGFVWRRQATRWEVADPAQSLAYPGFLGGTGNAAAWKSLVRSIGDMIQDQPGSRLREIQDHNQRLGKAFCETLGDGGDFRIVTPLLDGRPPSGLVSVAMPVPLGKAVQQQLTNNGYHASALGYEPVKWRAGAVNRCVVVCDGDWPRVGSVDKFTPARPSRAVKEFRFCFHYWHTRAQVVELGRLVTEARNSGRRHGAVVASSQTTL
ncbi:MAG: aminotransferase class V-fold PLP-dependent enzyme [Actinobacteria bacterium]|nr:aminotransferase class V-fold PLP-dependent enzyme [Actinomycetota bacterium]